jgi:hypothetical protein
VAHHARKLPEQCRAGPSDLRGIGKIDAGSLIATPFPGTMADRNTGAAMAKPAIPEFPAWARIAAVIIAAAAVLELLFAICWWWGVPGWLMTGTAIALAPPLAYGAWWLWWRLPKWQLNRLEPQIPAENPKERADVEDNFRKTVGQLLGGAAVLIGAAFALFQFLQQQKAAQEQQLTSQNQFREQQQAAHDLMISNQVSKGFEQLAGHDIAMRLGGIYALEGVMNTSEQYHGPVLEGLCAFVRESTIGKPVSKDGPATDVQAALTVIGRRKEGPGRVDLANVSIPGADLSGANLSPVNLSGADLRYANLSFANLGLANLSAANLLAANLSGTDLSNADLRFADLSGANLRDAKNLTKEQLDTACGNANTKLPEGLTIKPCPPSDQPKAP